MDKKKYLEKMPASSYQHVVSSAQSKECGGGVKKKNVEGCN